MPNLANLSASTGNRFVFPPYTDIKPTLAARISDQAVGKAGRADAIARNSSAKRERVGSDQVGQNEVPIASLQKHLSL